jgi:hypothetical protein
MYHRCKCTTAAGPDGFVCKWAHSDWCDKHRATLDRPVYVASSFQYHKGDRSGSEPRLLPWAHDRALGKSHAEHEPSIQLTVPACPRGRGAWRSDRRRYSHHIGSYRESRSGSVDPDTSPLESCTTRRAHPHQAGGPPRDNPGLSFHCRDQYIGSAFHPPGGKSSASSGL